MKESFVFLTLDVVKVVGKNETVQIYSLIARREAALQHDLLLEKLTAEALECIKGKKFERAEELYTRCLALGKRLYFVLCLCFFFFFSYQSCSS